MKGDNVVAQQLANQSVLSQLISGAKDSEHGVGKVARLAGMQKGTNP